MSNPQQQTLSEQIQSIVRAYFAFREKKKEIEKRRLSAVDGLVKKAEYKKADALKQALLKK